MTAPLPFTYDDGGRADAGFRGTAGDCVTRAIAIATQLPYRQVYDQLSRAQKQWARTSRSRHAKATRGNTSARDGVYRDVYDPWLLAHGFTWTSHMGIGTGVTVHVAQGEVPDRGTFILRLSKHITAVRDGVVHDTHDPARDGTRAVYGWYELTDPTKLGS